MMNRREELDPGWAWDAEFPLSQGLKLNNFVFLSGQVALDRDGNVIGENDLGAQSRHIFKNIKSILAQGGASLADVIKLTTFFTVDITDHEVVKGYFDARREFFGDLRPCSTGVQVSQLVDAKLLLEIEAIALLPNA